MLKYKEIKKHNTMVFLAEPSFVTEELSSNIVLKNCYSPKGLYFKPSTQIKDGIIVYPTLTYFQKEIGGGRLFVVGIKKFFTLNRFYYEGGEIMAEIASREGNFTCHISDIFFHPSSKTIRLKKEANYAICNIDFSITVETGSRPKKIFDFENYIETIDSINTKREVIINQRPADIKSVDEVYFHAVGDNYDQLYICLVCGDREYKISSNNFKYDPETHHIYGQGDFKGINRLMFDIVSCWIDCRYETFSTERFF